MDWDAGSEHVGFGAKKDYCSGGLRGADGGDNYAGVVFRGV